MSMQTPGGQPTLPTEPALRQRVLDAALALMIEQGVAHTTTLAVQKRAGVSRGALLHHFPTRAQLLSATVEALVARNEAAVMAMMREQGSARDGFEQAIRALAYMCEQPPFLAELELWATARVDEDLRAALIAAERHAQPHMERVVSALFAPVAHQPGQAAVRALTVELLRGLALSGVLRRSATRREGLVQQWVQAARLLLAHWPPPPN